MFNIIFPIIIFISLAVIVFIVGKHLPEFVDIKKETDGQVSSNKKPVRDFLIKFFRLTKNSLMWLIEKIIQKIKSFLSLIQSWVSKNRKSKPAVDVLEPQSEEGDNSSDGDFLKKIARKDEPEEASKKTSREDPRIEEKTKSKKGVFASFKDSLKEKILENKRKKINKVFQETDEYEEDNSQFSDGIVKIHEKKETTDNKGEMINEVVEIPGNKNKEMSLDDEMGVDRKILEKRLIGKIAQNLRDKEVYRQLGELYLKMENYGDAEGCYNQILKIAVRDIDAKRKIERIKLLKRSAR